MPSYLNSTDEVVYVEGLRLPPREVTVTNQFIRNLPEGISKSSDLPAYNPVISSEKCTGTSGTKEITIADTHTDYSIRIRVVSGSISVNLNSTDVVPAVVVLAGEQVEFMARNRSINKIVLTYIESSVAKVDVFAPASMRWEI